MATRRAPAVPGLPPVAEGVVAGRDDAGAPVLLRLFRPVPHHMVLVGGPWLGRLLALRATLAGARVLVQTARPREWPPVPANALSWREPPRVLPLGAAPGRTGDIDSPVLVLRDSGARPAPYRDHPAAWRTVVTLLPWLHPAAAAVLRTAPLVGAQRVSPAEAELLASALRLGVAGTRALPGFGPATVRWFAGPRSRDSTLRTTAAERTLIGEPRRIGGSVGSHELPRHGFARRRPR